MTFQERRQRVTDTSGVLVLLELSRPSSESVVRLVNDTRNWESNGEVYFAAPFRFKLPDDVNGQAPRAVLEIDNVGREMTADLEDLQPMEMIEAVVKVTDREDPDDIAMTFTIPLTQVSITQGVATAVLGVDHLMRGQSVRLRYNRFTTPGIF